MSSEIKKVLRKPYLFFTIIIFIVYLALNIFISGFYKNLPLLFIYASTVSWLKLGVSLILTIIIGLLVSVTSVLTYIKYKERKDCGKEAVISGVGGVGGLIVGVCPLCITGLSQLILGLFGAGFTFASLPFQGIEFQFGVVVILMISLYFLGRK